MNGIIKAFRGHKSLYLSGIILVLFFIMEVFLLSQQTTGIFGYGMLLLLPIFIVLMLRFDICRLLTLPKALLTIFLFSTGTIFVLSLLAGYTEMDRVILWDLMDLFGLLMAIPLFYWVGSSRELKKLCFFVFIGLMLLLMFSNSSNFVSGLWMISGLWITLLLGGMEKRRKIWLVGVTALLFLGIAVYFSLRNRNFGLVMSIFNGNQGGTFVTHVLRESLGTCGLFSPSNDAEIIKLLGVLNVRGEVTLSEVVFRYGVFYGVLIIGFFCILGSLLFRDFLRIREGKMQALYGGLGAMIFLPGIYNILCNFGIVPYVHSFLPFLGISSISGIWQAILIGLLLNISTRYGGPRVEE